MLMLLDSSARLSIMYRFFLISITLTGCYQTDCWEYKSRRFLSQCGYAVNTTDITPEGISVDTTNQQTSLDLIDSLFLETEECLMKNFNGIIPEEVRIAADCPLLNFPLPIIRSCISVKIPDDWMWNTDNTQQLLNLSAPEELCKVKGLSGEGCKWRAAIQNDTTIVITPDFYLLKDPLIRIVTGCNNPWAHPLLAECATNGTKI